MLKSKKRLKPAVPEMNITEEAELLFEKKFQYQKGSGNKWQLPPPEERLFSEFYQYESLQQLKDQLNNVKSKLNNYGVEEWSKHTNRRDPSGEVTFRLKHKTKAEFVTVAWCKLFECLHRYPLVTKPKLNSLHLCEAPGAFIAALNHYLHGQFQPEQLEWHWRATTLNPYHEGNALNQMISDDRFIFHTLPNWLFHEDFTGNLLQLKNMADMAAQCAKVFPDGVQLVTADGSIDCSAQPDCQEEIVSGLFVAEIISALSILSEGGSFLMKMFTLFEACSVSVMYMLNCIFKAVHIFKPATSKRGNSEIYVICLDYQRDTPGLARILEELRGKLDSGQDAMVMPMFSKSQIPKDFLLQHEIGCRLYLKLQVDAIEGSICAYQEQDRHYLRHLHQLRSLVCELYYSRYQVTTLPEELRVVEQHDTSQSLGMTVPVYGGSYTEREQLKQGDLLKQIYCLRREFNQLEKCSSMEHNSYKHVKFLPHPLQLQLQRGAAVTQLQSSLFALEPLLLLRRRIMDTFGLDPIWQMDARCELEGSQRVLHFDASSHAEGESFQVIQRDFFLQLLQSLLQLKPERIVFHNFPLLTHYATSLLLWLAEILYQELEFDASPAQGTITLKGLLDADQQLKDLLKLLQRDETILSFLSPQQLHRNPYGHGLMLYNNSVLVECYRRMLGEDAFPRKLNRSDAEIHQTEVVA